MATYQMTCMCGDVFEVDAENKDQAVEKIQAQMSEEAVQAHMEEKHSGQPVPPLSMVHQMVAQMTREA